MAPESGEQVHNGKAHENGQLFDTSDEGVGAAAAAAAGEGAAEAEDAVTVDAVAVDGADDGRRRRQRSAIKSGAFAGKPSALVDDLTLPQRAAVEHRGGPLLIIAGAGSGKTRVLTRRIAHLLATGDAPPWGVLAITFTNKAADEMRNRVADLVGPPAEKMWVSTFHSACLRILRMNADRLGYRSAFTVYDDTDSRRLIEMITAELGFDQKRLPSPRRAGGDQPGQVRTGGLRDVPRGRPQRARPVPQAHRRRLRPVPGTVVGGERARLR